MGFNRVVYICVLGSQCNALASGIVPSTAHTHTLHALFMRDTAATGIDTHTLNVSDDVISLLIIIAAESEFQLFDVKLLTPVCLSLSLSFPSTQTTPAQAARCVPSPSARRVSSPRLMSCHLHPSPSSAPSQCPAARGTADSSPHLPPAHWT